MASTKYKYRFTIDDISVQPVFDEGSSLKYDRESERVFMRLKLNGTFILNNARRKDFNVVWAKPLDHEFAFKAQFIVNGVVVDEINGTFYKTDCQFDEDSEITRIVVTTIDKYEKMMKALDKEFDLIKELAPPIYQLYYKKEPLLQVVFPFHSVMFSKIGSTTFLTELSQEYNQTELEDFGFRNLYNGSDGGIVYIPGSGDLTPDVSGIYVQVPATTNFVREDGIYSLNRGEITKWRITEVSTGSVKYRGNDDTIPGDGTMIERNPFERTIILYKVGDTAIQCAPFPVIPYQRILTDADTVAGTPTIALPEPDINDMTFDYAKYVDMSAEAYNLYYAIVISDDHTVVPNKFGKFAADALHFAGEYFDVNINPFPFTRAYPLFDANWREYHVTIYKSATMPGAFFDDATTNTLLKDAYKLEEVIKRLLFHIDPSLHFDSTAFYSKFLFDDLNPLTGDSQPYTHFITPKTNILKGDYDNPQTKGKITFGWVEELLMNALNCFWWIDEMSNFRIEHLHYFKNGRSYDVAPSVGIDLTTQIEPTTNKPWAYHTTKYGYRKDKLPEELRFSWMDDVSDYFDGFPIKILSNFVEKGNFKDNKVSNFTSDISYAIANQSGINQDGFFVMACELVGDDWFVQYEEFDVLFFNDIILQNGFWSFYFLHDKFWRHYLPAQDVNLNDTDITATTTQRAKEQNIVYPAPIHPDPMRLIKTSIGIGEIEEMEINLTSRKAVIKCLHDLDFDNPCPTC